MENPLILFDDVSWCIRGGMWINVCDYSIRIKVRYTLWCSFRSSLWVVEFQYQYRMIDQISSLRGHSASKRSQPGPLRLLYFAY